MLCALRQIRLTRYLSPAVRKGVEQKGRVKGQSQQWLRWASSSSSSQSDLPKLPVPALKSTMDKYLAAVRPLVSDEEYSETERIVQEFIKSPGPDLQKILEKRAEEETNWLSEWWKNVAYLDYRLPVVVNFNPGVVFPRQKYRGEDERLRFAAKFIAGVLDYKIMIDEGTLPVDTLGGKPLCMSQYYKILSACRIPGLKKDKHVIFPGNRPDAPRHIIVFHNNHMFAVDVYGSKGKPLNEVQLFDQLQRIMEQSQHPATPVGLFTTMDRDSWASVYNDLTKNKKNKAAMQDVHRSIFALCLDKPMAEGNTPYNKALIATQMLHGGGAHLNSGNRWFDKTLQFIVGTDGACGLNYEHTVAEGPPVVGIVDYVLDYVQGKREGSLPAADIISPRRLDVALSSKAKDALQLADQEMAALVQDIQMTVVDFEDYGKEFIKKCRLSPDAYIQVAFQLTFYRLFKKPCATYESGSLRQFQLGRTDTIRSCTVDSHAFTQAMDNPSMPATAKVALLQQAVKTHRNYTNQVVSGQGIDRHLLGLKLAALESGRNIPAIHLDTSFSESTYFRVSTSQVGAKHNSVLCFGPVVPDGFGVCYNPQKNHIVFSISAFHMCSETDSDQFGNVLRGSLLDMQKLLKEVPAENLG